ncbi:MAG: primosomal protein N', partial [Candidatus Omnitrophica bacterium]|nr:primosomal protein N' [Candidatus Omnitrophota bacterium]
VGLTHKSNIKRLKAISGLIDERPILDKNMLFLTKELSEYYCCSWGEAIETALPQALRKDKLLPELDYPVVQNKTDSLSQAILIHEQDGGRRWDYYIEAIKEALSAKKSAIVILPDIEAVSAAEGIIKSRLQCSLLTLHRNQAQELEAWSDIKAGKIDLALGTRSAIFAPLNNLGLVIIDQEESFAYKQDQVPHYHAREAAFMRAKIEKAKLILGSSTPSLETISLAREGKISYLFMPRESAFAEVKITDARRLESFDRKKSAGLSRYLEDSILQGLNSKSKILVFLNRKGFATFASCNSCGATLKCPRCNINLVYHFKESNLSCHYCNFKISPPKACPECNTGYIKYSGAGIEKVESELSRIFPQAKIKVLDKSGRESLQDGDIFIATESILGAKYQFDIAAALSIDNSLNRIDLRASEKAFRLLYGLLSLTKERLLIQTSLPGHHVFTGLAQKDTNIFYTQELKQRKQLHFPPYAHLGLVKIRGKKESRVKDIASALFRHLNERKKGRGVKVLSLNPGQPAKLRGNFYWQILLRSVSPQKMSSFLKINLKDFRHSGIIITADIDPL